MSRETVWIAVQSLNGLYEVSNTGEIRNAKTKHILKQFTNQFGYQILQVCPTRGEKKNVMVHRLVAEAFLGKCPSGLVVNHKDGIKKNNIPENLEYVTPSQNNQHALDTGLRKPADMKKYSPRGKDHYCAKITEEDANNVRKLRAETGYGARRIAKILDLPYGAVGNIIYRNGWLAKPE